MDLTAPAPSGQKSQNTAHTPSPEETAVMITKRSTVTVTVAGCGGAGINFARHFTPAEQLEKVLFFDTSLTNTMAGERAWIFSDGSGSGSNRAENALDIERQIPQIKDDELGVNDVAIVMFSLGGGSGSVIGPILLREYAKRHARVIGVVVADTSSAVSAKNSMNTLKTLAAIAKNNNLYLPLLILSNDHANTRREVDEHMVHSVTNIINILTKEVREVDRNDRLNWIDPTKVIRTHPGLKIISVTSDKSKSDSKIIIGANSKEMLDSLLILQTSVDEPIRDTGTNSLSRLKKVGFYDGDSNPRLIGTVSSDISEIDSIIESIERMANAEKSQSHSALDRLTIDDNGGDLYL